MNKNHQEYELNILKKVINEHLDQVIPVTDEGLNHLLSHHDDMVWNIATKIYSQSGYKLEFYFIRDVVNSWIEVLKQRIEKEKDKRAEQARLQAEQQAERQAKQARLQQRLQAEQARLQAEQARIQAERQAEQARLEAEQARIEAKRLAELAQISISDLFIKVQPIISEQLSVEFDKVTLSSHISNELSADEFDIVELLMALEEEFDIEIPDGYSPVNIWPFSSYSKPVPNPCTYTVAELLEYIRQQLSDKYVEYEKSHPILRQNDE